MSFVIGAPHPLTGQAFFLWLELRTTENGHGKWTQLLLSTIKVKNVIKRKQKNRRSDNQCHLSPLLTFSSKFYNHFISKT